MGRHRNDVVRAAIGVRMLLRKDALRLHPVAPVPRERRRRFLDVDAVDLDSAIGGIQELNENEKRGWGSEQLAIEAELFTMRGCGDKRCKHDLGGYAESRPAHAEILTRRAMVSCPGENSWRTGLLIPVLQDRKVEEVYSAVTIEVGLGAYR